MSDETDVEIPVAEVFADFTMLPLPDGAKPGSTFMLIKLDNGDWCVRALGDDYNRTEILGQLTAYTHALVRSEAEDWIEID